MIARNLQWLVTDDGVGVGQGVRYVAGDSSQSVKVSYDEGELAS
jgi:hypothetical protein